MLALLLNTVKNLNRSAEEASIERFPVVVVESGFFNDNTTLAFLDCLFVWLLNYNIEIKPRSDVDFASHINSTTKEANLAGLVDRMIIVE